MIQNVGTQFTQWDTGRSVSISDSAATHIHFANQGDSKAVIIEIVGGTAKVPDYLFHTGKTVLAYAVLDGVTLESKSFSVRKRERPENYVYEDDQRNYIYELITNAENAVKDAGAAVTAANNAAANASAATARATTATGNANTAANNANTAADSANKAAAKAANTAKSLMVVGQAEGSPISLDDAIDQYFVGFRIFGKTIQNGTPTPEAPVDLVSVGDSGSVAVNVAGTYDTNGMTIATPNGLSGIPVKTGGNYTDANGQQWICDEIDLARGVYVQRILKRTLTGQEVWTTYSYPGYSVFNAFRFQTTNLIDVKSADAALNTMSVKSNYFSYGGLIGKDLKTSIGVSEERFIYLRFDGATDTISTKDKLANWLASKYASGNPVIIQYPLATPIETPLSEEELAAYAALHTYRDNTTVSNNASAYMGLEYVMDAKKYIDSLVGPGGSASARLADITLSASKWTTNADGLHSQVVTITGITEYSKVDLLPSVEQLAIFHNKDVAFVTENEDGVVTVYAIGDVPTQNYTMQVSITEVTV